MTDLEDREAFETWYIENYHDGDIFPNNGILDFNNHHNEYRDSLLNMLWESWQASGQRQGFKLAPLEPSEEMYSDLSRHLCRYMQIKDRYCPKTLGEYIKRYIGFKNIPQWLHDEVRDWESTHAFTTADLGVFIYKAMIDAV